MKRKMRSSSRRSSHFFAKTITFFAILLIITALVDMQIRPIVTEIVSYQAQSRALQIIDRAMLEKLQALAVDYEDIVRVHHGENGSVRSVQTNSLAVNMIKTQLIESVTDAMSDTANQQIDIPIGTLSGNNLMSGRGPLVQVQILPVSYARAEIKNQFVSEGINQTLHQIVLEVDVELSAILPGYRVRTHANSNFLIAETVIVGPIPEGYTIVGEDGRSSLSKMYDYKAE